MTTAMTNFPKLMHVYRHHSGSEYLLLAVTNAKTANQERFPQSAVYVNVNNYTLWSRPLVEFMDPTKFTCIFKPSNDFVGLVIAGLGKAQAMEFDYE